MLYTFTKNVQYKPIQCKLRIFQKKKFEFAQNDAIFLYAIAY